MKKEVKRQIVHILFGLVLAVIVSRGQGIWIPVLAGILLVVSFLELRGVEIPLIHDILNAIEREYEREYFRASGAIWFALGAAVVVEFFSVEIALAAIMIVTFGDAVQRLVHPFSSVPHPWIEKRNVEGVLISIGISTVFASLFVPFVPALVGSTAAMLVESFDIRLGSFRVDDNFIIPVVAAIVIALI